MRIDVVDNGGQWTHREWRVLKYLGIESKIIPNTIDFDEIEVDGLVLSGGAPRIGTEAIKLGNTADILDKANFPILGICIGAQFIVTHYGGKADAAETAEFGAMDVIITESGDILEGINTPFKAWESHNDEIKILPEDFINLAHSESCAIQAIQHREPPFYGFQFHPEVDDTQFGKEMFENFIEIVRKLKE
ncbi:MAG: GMP synthase subunit A [Thermoplasmata archaeon]|nr:GMP synthase subunit A [Thermoplasmata archaeon]